MHNLHHIRYARTSQLILEDSHQILTLCLCSQLGVKHLMQASKKKKFQNLPDTKHHNSQFIMATAYHNLSEYDFNSVPNAEDMKFGIVVSEWNYNITGALLKGAVETLKKHGAKEENILVKTVPGSSAVW